MSRPVSCHRNVGYLVWLIVTIVVGIQVFCGRFYRLTSPPEHDDRDLNGALWYFRVMLRDIWGLMLIYSSIFAHSIKKDLTSHLLTVLVTNCHCTQVGEIHLKPGCLQVLQTIWDIKLSYILIHFSRNLSSDFIYLIELVVIQYDCEFIWVLDSWSDICWVCEYCVIINCIYLGLND